MVFSLKLKSLPVSYWQQCELKCPWVLIVFTLKSFYDHLQWYFTSNVKLCNQAMNSFGWCLHIVMYALPLWLNQPDWWLHFRDGIGQSTGSSAGKSQKHQFKQDIRWGLCFCNNGHIKRDAAVLAEDVILKDRFAKEISKIIMIKSLFSLFSFDFFAICMFKWADTIIVVLCLLVNPI